MLRRTLCYNTRAKSEVVPITEELDDIVAESGIRDGTLIVYSLHTTFGLIIQEAAEPRLCEDFTDFLVQAVADDGRAYKHSCALHPSGTCVEDRFNAPSHVRQLLTNQPIVLDIANGRLSLGRWQDVAYFEHDGPRRGRQVLVKVIAD